MSHKYALFVGNSDYDSEGLFNLKSPIADVQDLANLFRDSSIGGFDEVTELINSTESKIRQIISRFFLNKKPEDLLLLYFSGHGILDDRGELFLAAKDTQPNLLRATAISADFIADDMDRCRSKRQILILDCCHSGAFRRGIKGDDTVLTATTFKGNGSGRIVLTASDRREFAMEGNQVLEQAKTSLFTHFLLEGIKTGDADKDGDSFISLDEWYDYAYDKVVENLPTQTPRRWAYNQEGRLIIARNPNPIKSSELPREIGEAIEDNRTSVRLGATARLAEILNGRDKRRALAARSALQSLQKDKNPEVRETAGRILASYDSGINAKLYGFEHAGPDTLPDSVGVWNKLWAILTQQAIRLWKPWVIASVLTVIVSLGVWGLFSISDRNISNSEAESSLTEQAQLGTGGQLDISPELSEPDDDIQESSPSTGNQSSEGQEDDGQQSSSPSYREGESGGDGTIENQRDLIPNDEQRPIENGLKNGDETDTSGEPEATREEQKNPPSLMQPGEDNIAETDAEENPGTPMESPLDRVLSETDELQISLEQAIMNRQWDSVPAPISDYYEERLENLYSRFDIINVDVSSTGQLQSDEATATLPVTVNISYQQKGRENLNPPLLIPTIWEWKKDGKEFMLTKVTTNNQ